jgi:hypothetical protein
LVDFTEFLGRLDFVDPYEREKQAFTFVAAACRVYYSVQIDRVAFPVLLYRYVLRWVRLADRTLASVLASPASNWFRILDPAEQWFLDQCATFLPEPDVLLLYLQMYAGLSATEIAEVLQVADADCRTDQVVAALLRAWRNLL